MDVAGLIREQILAGDLVPNQRLVEADLAEQFAVSRTAARETANCSARSASTSR